MQCPLARGVLNRVLLPLTHCWTEYVDETHTRFVGSLDQRNYPSRPFIPSLLRNGRIRTSNAQIIDRRLIEQPPEEWRRFVP
jgi:hypothetical protein